VVLEQVRLTLMALGLALMMAPVAATIEPLIELSTMALPNFVPSAPCEGTLSLLITAHRPTGRRSRGPRCHELFPTSECFSRRKSVVCSLSGRQLTKGITLEEGAAA
jgi:hypothetical protein